MYVYMYVCKGLISTQNQNSLQVLIYFFIHMHACMYVCIYVCVQGFDINSEPELSAGTNIIHYIYMHACMHACMYVCIYEWVCVNSQLEPSAYICTIHAYIHRGLAHLMSRWLRQGHTLGQAPGNGSSKKTGIS